jgi:hypothetical protein
MCTKYVTSSVLWNVTPCKSAEINRLFDKLTGSFFRDECSKEQTSMKQAANRMLVKLLGLHFDPEDGGNIFLEGGTLHSHRCAKTSNPTMYEKFTYSLLRCDVA